MVTEYLTDRLVKAVSGEILTGTCQVVHQQALLIAQAKAYIRDSQARLILAPIAEQLVSRLGRRRCWIQLASLLIDCAGEARASSYAGGNILNLLLHLDGSSRL